MSVKCIPPYTPLLYSKTGICRGMPIFLVLLQNIDCGYLLEPPRQEPVLTSTHNLCFGAKILVRKILKNDILKIFNFYNLKFSVFCMDVYS